MSGSTQILYSRLQDGGCPVRALPEGYRVITAQGNQLYKNKQALLAGLTGHPEGRHWGFDRYFGLGRYALTPSTLLEGGDVLELFNGGLVLPGRPLAPTVLEMLDERITVPPPPLVPLATPVRVELGIDLERRGGEVAKLLFAGFGRKIHAAGYDPDDVLQQVYLGIIARNSGRCAWDASKSSFGHYVHMVCGCVLANYHRKQRGVSEHEQTGMLSIHGWDDVGASSCPAPADEQAELVETGSDLADYLRRRMSGVAEHELRLVQQAMSHLLAGRTRKETAALLGVSAPTLSRALALAEPHARAWRG